MFFFKLERSIGFRHYDIFISPSLLETFLFWQKEVKIKTNEKLNIGDKISYNTKGLAVKGKENIIGYCVKGVDENGMCTVILNV